VINNGPFAYQKAGGSWRDWRGILNSSLGPAFKISHAMPQAARALKKNERRNIIFFSALGMDLRRKGVWNTYIYIDR
jgi:hypothetical protein